MGLIARHDRKVKGCVIAGSGYAFFAVGYIFSQPNAQVVSEKIGLLQAENDNSGSDIARLHDSESVKEQVAYSVQSNVGAVDIPENAIVSHTESAANANIKQPKSNCLKKEILNGKAFYVEGKIGSNFYTSAQLAHVPANVIKSFINVLKGKINFRSSLRSGDKFAVAYSKENGRVLYAHIKSRKHDITVYKGADNDNKYYYKNGSPINGNVEVVEFKKPVNYSRISSPYGYRLHPITGTFKKHNGIDYAAPLGSPVYVAYDGKIVKQGVDKYLGKHIIVKHANGYETVYAHLSAFNNSLNSGQYILCGTRLGSVGSTGRSTGPHLHFSLKKNGAYINPAIRLSTPKAKLCGNSLNKFHKCANRIDAAIQNAKN